jgi:DNA repair protein RadA/Sms
LEQEGGRKPQPITEIDFAKSPRAQLPDEELNRVLGGGLVPGSLILLGGEPGIGKSTLLLQLVLQFDSKKVFYVSGEESEQQIKMRADRIGISNEQCYLYTETNLDNIFVHLKNLNPDVVIVDSIQTMHTPLLDAAAGSVSQIRACAAEWLKYAKTTHTPVILVGHINKEGSIAGPKVLEHMVDTVLQFEGDRNHIFRLLRAVKNRFGSTHELGIYEMRGSGLRTVNNPSEILISNRDKGLSGTAISATMEGLRPMLIEIQALVSTAAYGTPQRSATGFDLRRLSMLLAVLEKRCGFRLAAKDVFLNIAGGIKVDDPAIDLGVVCAILSSNEDEAISPNTCFAAEVGLSGEIRPVNRIELRIREAEKLGFEQIFVSTYNMKGLDASSFGIEVVQVSKIEEVYRRLF